MCLKRLIAGDLIPTFVLSSAINVKKLRQLSHQLREDGYKVGEIHGNLEPRERRQMMRRIQNYGISIYRGD